MIEVKNLNKTYDRGRPGANHVLHDITLTLPEKGFVCILGPSGCGKTSLLNAMGGLDEFDSGTLRAGDAQVRRYGTALFDAERNRSFGYIFQNYYLLDSHTVAYNVYMGLHALDMSHEEKLRRVKQALEAVDMARFLRRRVRELSGGQQQRVAIARALARRPRVIFADEPTGNLDEANTYNICSLLRQASKESLVVMVTHEQSIAKFFADRIITLEEGRIVSDRTDWHRDSLLPDGRETFYTADFSESNILENGLELQLLRQENAAPVRMTLVATADRIVLKLSDERIITQSNFGEAPIITPGSRPTAQAGPAEETTLGTDLFREPPAKQCRAGKGFGFGMLLAQALELMQGRGMKKAGIRLFLTLLTALTLYVAADFIAISRIDPEDFIKTDSHILDLKLESGGETREDGYNFRVTIREYIDALAQSGLDMDFIPGFAAPPEFAVQLFSQMDSAALQFPAFSYAPLHRLDESTLLYGRMSERFDEIVVDRQVLEAAMEDAGVVSNSITGIDYFLGKQLTYLRAAFPVTIVGICDSGERSLYISPTAMVCLGAGGVDVISISEAQRLYPETDWSAFTLESGQCIVNLSTVGMIWRYRMGQTYPAVANTDYTAAHYVDIPDMTAAIIVPDGEIGVLLRRMGGASLQLYCADKDAVRAHLRMNTEWEEKGYLTYFITDRYQLTYDAYVEATTVRMDGRMVVILAVLLASVIMLYVLCRAQTQERTAMLAVYRLLGIPRRKAAAIFAMESVLTCLVTVLPSGILTWAAVYLARGVESWDVQLLLPGAAAALVCAALFAYHLLVSLLPVWRLLRLPPAQLAAKYDI